MKYEVIYSGRTTLALQVTREGELLVRAPRGCPRRTVENFVNRHADWVEKKRKEAGQKKNFWPVILPEEEKALREKARRVLSEKVRFYGEQMQVTYGRITIRGQKTRWGSCSSAGNLNFNWKLMLCPERVQDYVVIHELAHRREMNHSARFYGIVAEFMPDYRDCRKWLRDHPLGE